MPTHDYVIANGTGSSVRSDINDALAAIVSQNSSSTAPATTYAYMIWVDTTTNIVKMRNGANSAWIELFETDGEFGSKTFNGNVTLNAQGDLRFADSDSSNWVAFQAPATVASNVTWTLPNADGTSGQTLQTNGSGTLSWVTPSATVDKIEEGNTSAEVVDTGSDGHFKVTTEGSERLRVDSSGNCGIGTASPASDALLTLQGTNRNIFFLSDGAPTDCAIDCSGGRFVFRGGGSGTTVASIPEQMRLDENNRLLVGTTSSSTNVRAIFQASSGNSSGGSIVRLAAGNANPGNNGSVGYLAFCDNSHADAAYISVEQDGSTWTSGSDMPTRMVFATTADGASSPTERMRIRNTGSQLLATADNSEPGIQLNVNASSGSQNGMRITTANDQNSIFQYFFACYGSSTQRATIRTDGGLANYSANNANLSDRNAKKDISPAADTWDCIKEWEIVNYRYKDQPDDADLNLGVIAQQVAESCPEVITVFEEAKEAKPAVLDDDGNEIESAQEAQPEKLGIKEQQMYWMAIKALQEAQVRIEALEAEVAALKAQ